MALRLGQVDEVPDGEMRSFEVGDRRIAVANVGGTLSAFEDDCSHQHCLLTGGDLEGDRVICPCHGSEFRVSSGEVLNPPAASPIAVFPVRVEDGAIVVEPG